MKLIWNSHRPKLLIMLCALAIAAGCATTAPPRLNENDLLAAGFKVLVATTTLQQERVRELPPGEIRPMQRTGKKYFVYPDAPRNQVYVGGPKEYEAFRRAHPEYQPVVQESGMASYVRQSDAMRDATARDLSDPFLGASWYDLGW